MEKPWGPRLVEVVAGEVRRHRKARGMSTQALADACAALGWPIKRTVLSNLESGYRETITVPELFVIAQALEVPPLRLLLPLGYADTIEVMPGIEVETTRALRWLMGEKPLPGTHWEDLDTEDGSPTIASFTVHQNALDRWTWARYYAQRIRQGDMEGDAEQSERDADRAAEHLRSIRHVMRARGLTPPPLPPELAHIEAVREP